jgi:hypothetical protein
MTEVKNTPRYLTTEEINDIVNMIPKVKSASHEASAVATIQIKNSIAIQLKEIKIKPSKIKKLKEEILTAYYRSRVEPGNPTGIEASEGVGGPATQMTLNTFHSAGSNADAGAGLDIIRELLNISPVRRVKSSIIHFKDKYLTFEEVIHLKQEIIGISIFNLLKSTPKVIRSTICNESGEDIPIPYNNRGWWYDSYINIMMLENWDSPYYTRLIIDRSKMFSHGITPTDIMRTIKAEQNDLFNCVVSPSVNKDIYIDVYPSPSMSADTIETLGKKKKTGISGIDTTNSSLFVLKYFFIPELDKFNIKGINGVTNVFPENIKLMSVIKTCVKTHRVEDYESLLSENPQLTEDDLRNTWDLWLDVLKMSHMGIPVNKIERLLELCGVQIVETPVFYIHNPDSIYPKPWTEPRVNPIKFIVLMRGNGIDGKHPTKYVNSLIDEEEAKSREIVKEKIKENPDYIDDEDVSDLIRYGSYCYAKTNGANLDEILKHPLIDSSISITNNPNNIYYIIGIQAIYTFIVGDFYKTILSSSAYCNPQHIETLVKVMTNSLPTAITSNGIARQRRGAFADASFEHAVDVFVKSAAGGQWEGSKATSASIFFGDRGNFGTGAFKLSLNHEAIEEIYKNVNSKEISKEKLKDLAKTAGAFLNSVSADASSFSLGDGGGKKKSQLESLIKPSDTAKPLTQLKLSMRIAKMGYSVSIKMSTPGDFIVMPRAPRLDTELLQVMGLAAR